MNDKLKEEDMSKVNGGAADNPRRYPDPSYGACFYKVKEGDSLSSIADYVNCTISELISWNNIKKGVPIYAGMSLKYYTHFLYN